MTQANLKEIFQAHDTGVVSTSDDQGQVDSAIFGSCRLIDEQTVLIGLGNNRTLANLRRNPHATLLFATPGTTVFNWRGARIYLKLGELAESGPVFDETIRAIEKQAGKMAARMITTVAFFRVTEVRPLIDFPGGS